MGCGLCNSYPLCYLYAEKSEEERENSSKDASQGERKRG
jgi:hypothetical protein